MGNATITTRVQVPAHNVGIIDVTGEVTNACEQALLSAYAEASGSGVRSILLNFNGMQYMNSSGIGLLVTLLVRANRAKQKLLACGLDVHYQEIFSMTRLDEAIGIYPTEDAALAYASQHFA